MLPTAERGPGYGLWELDEELEVLGSKISAASD